MCYNTAMEKKPRSAAQKAADKRYQERHPNKERNISFKIQQPLADEIDAYIKQNAVSKADFLRRAVEAHKDGKF